MENSKYLNFLLGALFASIICFIIAAASPIETNTKYVYKYVHDTVFVADKIDTIYICIYKNKEYIPRIGHMGMLVESLKQLNERKKK